MARIVYVDANAAGLDNGSSWTNAYEYLQDALADANGVAEPVEVRVAQGLYRPDQGRSVTAGNRRAVFSLRDGVSILGGFAGVQGMDPNVRDPNACPTILSGDLKGNDVWWDVTLNVPPEVQNSHSDNSECIVDAGSSGPTAILDGVQIKGVWYVEMEGRRDPGTIDKSRQGGLFIDSGYPLIRDCVFTENLACSVKNIDRGNPTFTACRFFRNHSLYSAALFTNESNVAVSRCTFENNVASREGGAMVCANGEATIVDSVFLHNVSGYSSGGGAILNWGSRMSLTACDFRNNTTRSDGGAISSMLGSAETTLVDCTLRSNASSGDGGALNGGEVTIKGCDFQSNTATGGWGGAIEANCNLITGSVFTANQALIGGAISCSSRHDLPIENCMFTGNKARDNGGAIHFGGRIALTINRCSLQGNRSARGNALDASSSSILITNSIIWDANAFPGYMTAATITFSDIYNPCNRSANIYVDPCFARLGYWDPNGTPADANDDFWVDGDYHLKSQAGRWDPNSHDWVTDDVTSPCIDAGDPNSPAGDEPQPNGGRINMGAYGGTVEASKSYPSQSSAKP